MIVAADRTVCHRGNNIVHAAIGYSEVKSWFLAFSLTLLERNNRRNSRVVDQSQRLEHTCESHTVGGRSSSSSSKLNCVLISLRAFRTHM